MKVLMMVLSLIVCILAGMFIGYNSGGAQAIAEIKASCDDENVQKTYIGGHAYFCNDYDKTRATIDYLLHRGNQS